MKQINLKTQLCNQILGGGQAEEGDVIRHSYSTNRMKNFKTQNSKSHDCSPTLDTRCDCLGVVVKNNLKESEKVIVTGNYMPSGHSASRIVSVEGIAPTVMENHGTITAVNQKYRIRKLTPKECFRLMGVKDEDFNKVAINQSNASLYHLAGDSIVVNVLMAIFDQMIKEKV